MAFEGGSLRISLYREALILKNLSPIWEHDNIICRKDHCHVFFLNICFEKIHCILDNCSQEHFISESLICDSIFDAATESIILGDGVY